MNKAKSEQRPGIVNKGIEERRDREEKRAQNHHTFAPEHVGERTGGQFEENAGDRRSGDNDADEFGKRAEMGGKGWQHRASCHLIAEARQEAREHDGAEAFIGPSWAKSSFFLPRHARGDNADGAPLASNAPSRDCECWPLRSGVA